MGVNDVLHTLCKMVSAPHVTQHHQDMQVDNMHDDCQPWKRLLGSCRSPVLSESTLYYQVGYGPVPTPLVYDLLAGV